jgi:hypothetical protein
MGTMELSLVVGLGKPLGFTEKQNRRMPFTNRDPEPADPLENPVGARLAPFSFLFFETARLCICGSRQLVNSGLCLCSAHVGGLGPDQKNGSRLLVWQQTRPFGTNYNGAQRAIPRSPGQGPQSDQRT